MKKLQKTIKEINKTVVEVQEYLPTQTIDFSLMAVDDTVNIDITSEDNEFSLSIPTYSDESYLGDTDVKTVLLYCISYLYKNNIKQYKRYISRTKTLYKNRIGKLSKLMNEFGGKVENVDIFNKNFVKYTNLVADLTIRYSENKEYEEALQFCDDVAQTSYEVLNLLCADWKQEDIADYVMKNGYECKLNKDKTILSISISIKNDMDEVVDTLNVNVNNYSRKNDVINMINMQKQILKDKKSEVA